ncbi:hypothetical protein [Acidocella sp.]|nr:hypothetical protein [Acidocella sp.]MDD2796223.1 hypothetical protein [Acidocella sp.]
MSKPEISPTVTAALEAAAFRALVTYLRANPQAQSAFAVRQEGGEGH